MTVSGSLPTVHPGLGPLQVVNEILQADPSTCIFHLHGFLEPGARRAARHSACSGHVGKRCCWLLAFGLAAEKMMPFAGDR